MVCAMCFSSLDVGSFCIIALFPDPGQLKKRVKKPRKSRENTVKKPRIAAEMTFGASNVGFEAKTLFLPEESRYNEANKKKGRRDCPWKGFWILF
ncbi:MAG: hypothetical protein IKP32_07430 [Clostridia bacterium]|nr:hypothetical protein [Clostridia bacterium]